MFLTINNTQSTCYIPGTPLRISLKLHYPTKTPWDKYHYYCYFHFADEGKEVQYRLLVSRVHTGISICYLNSKLKNKLT